jgi:hypothetical protein
MESISLLFAYSPFPVQIALIKVFTPIIRKEEYGVLGEEVHS